MALTPTTRRSQIAATEQAQLGPAGCDLGVTARGLVFLEFPAPCDNWYLTPKEAREIAAALDALALRAEGRDPS